jgi:hypothetical protein
MNFFRLTQNDQFTTGIVSSPFTRLSSSCQHLPLATRNEKFFSSQRTCGKGKAMGEQQKHLNLHRSCTYDVNAFAILTLRAKHFIPTRDLNVNAILCTLATHPHSYLSLCAFTSEVFFIFGCMENLWGKLRGEGYKEIKSRSRDSLMIAKSKWNK